MPVEWIARETIRCSTVDLQCDAECFTDDLGAITVVLQGSGLRRGSEGVFQPEEAAALETELRRVLTVRRWIGIPIGRREVHVQRTQHIS